jgi:Na+-transporting methylmalonyl-CoA/oxaloacetate decarboxylase beta subunit
VPLNVTVLVPWAGPKFVPTIFTEVPTTPDVGDRLVILGVGATVKLTPLLALPPTVTTTLPVVAPVGTVTFIEVAPQLVIVVAVVVLNFTVLVPCVEPKFVPVIVTDAPTAPEIGDKLVMLEAANKALDETIDSRMKKASCDVLLSLILPRSLFTAESVCDSG